MHKLIIFAAVLTTTASMAEDFNMAEHVATMNAASQKAAEHAKSLQSLFNEHVGPQTQGDGFNSNSGHGGVSDNNGSNGGDGDNR